jgi:D-arginine dehydrogenase
MDTQDIDAVVIGAGIVGATVSAHLVADRRVALVEAEDVAGYHTTGRSAAIWLQNYGPPDAQALTRASRDFLTAPPAGFAATPLLAPRGAMYLATAEQEPELRAMLADAQGLREISIPEVMARVPALRPGFAVAAVIEDEAADLDVAAMHQGFLALHRRRGGTQALRSRAGRIARTAGMWEVEVTGGAVFKAPLVVNAAGAWGDTVAELAGVDPLGLEPKRRTACIIDPAPYDVSAWPMLHDMGDGWYCRPDARTRLMVSPADETPSFAHDVQPEEIDVAIGIDNMQQALAIEVRRVERSWAGLRTFTPDRSLAIGFDPRVDGFFWCVGQGGYGIQTSPAVGALVADLVAGRDPGALRAILSRVDPARFTS